MKKLFLIVLILSAFLQITEAQNVEVTVSRPRLSVYVDHGYGYRTVRHRRSNGRYYYKRHYYTAPRHDGHYKSRGHKQRSSHGNKGHQSNGKKGHKGHR